jgi:hypothetical protein
MVARSRLDRPRHLAVMYSVDRPCRLICTVPAKTAPPSHVPPMLYIYIPSSLFRVLIFIRGSEYVAIFYDGLDGLCVPPEPSMGRSTRETATGSGGHYESKTGELWWRYTAAHCCRTEDSGAQAGRQLQRDGRKQCHELLGLGGDAVNASLS